MPLSEHEQRLLEQMERALYAEDPKFATSMRNPTPGAGDRRRVALGVLAFLAGHGTARRGVATQLVVVGVLGFLAMLGGIWLAVSALRPWPAPATPRRLGRPAAGPAPTPITQVRPRARRSHASAAVRSPSAWSSGGVGAGSAGTCSLSRRRTGAPVEPVSASRERHAVLLR